MSIPDEERRKRRRLADNADPAGIFLATKDTKKHKASLLAFLSFVFLVAWNLSDSSPPVCESMLK